MKVTDSKQMKDVNEEEKDIVLSLDINNPDHIKQYASSLGITINTAKIVLKIHQDDILNERKSQSTNINNEHIINSCFPPLQNSDIVIKQFISLFSIIGKIKKLTYEKTDEEIKIEISLESIKLKTSKVE